MNPGESAAYAAKLQALLPVINAHARGEVIEYKAKTGTTWSVVPSPIWDINPNAGDYRVKPAPKEVYVLYKNDVRWGVYDDRSDATAALASRLRADEHNKIKNKWEVMAFVEVTK